MGDGSPSLVTFLKKVIGPNVAAIETGLDYSSQNTLERTNCRPPSLTEGLQLYSSLDPHALQRSIVLYVSSSKMDLDKDFFF